MAVIARDLGAFTDLKRRLEAAARGGFLPELAARIGAAFVKQVADEFRESRDPYGNPWAPVVRNRARDRRAKASRAKRGLPARADKPLIDTGRLRGSAVARVSGTEVRIALPVEYASYHQQGTRRMVRRQILPEGDTGGLGPYWTMAANKESAAVMLKHLGRKA
jgi:phage gpG-like protein